MYQTSYFNKKTQIVHLWDDEKGYLKIPYQPYAYQKNKTGKYISLYGDKLEKITEFSKNDKTLFESDVNPVTRTLIDLYSDSDDISTNHKVLFFDIETQTTGGASKSNIAEQPITAIAYYYNDKYVCLILDKNKKQKEEILNGNHILWFNKETDLLRTFINHWIKIRPTIVSHWNGDNYDIPYLINRAFRILPKRFVKRLSPLETINLRNENSVVEIVGVESLDLMLLYKKFVQNQLSSYSLNYVSNHELGHGKIEYEGSLDDLYNSDINKFITYNIEDVVLLVELEKKLNYIDLARNLCHKGHVPYSKVYMNSVILDGASLTWMRRNNIVAPNKQKPHVLKAPHNQRKGLEVITMDKEINKEKVPASGALRIKKSKTAFFSVKYSHFNHNQFFLKEKLPQALLTKYDIKVELPGAYVKTPIPGVYDWIYDLDLASLYPSIIMLLNISPETKRGRVFDWNEVEFAKNVKREYKLELITGEILNLNHIEFKKWIKDKNYSIASNGVMYDQSFKGFIPTILSHWFAERKTFKKARDEYKRNGDMDNTSLFNQKQITQKVLLNSFYGVMALSVFRFFDIDNAEAVTATGQSIIKFSAKSIEYYYNTQSSLTTYESAYCDTDSVFCSSIPFIENTKKLSDEEMTKKTIEVALNAEKWVNESYTKYAQLYHNTAENTHLLMKQEMVSKTGFWVTKKRYAQLVINEEHVQLNENNTPKQWQVFDNDKFAGRLDIKGLDIIRSDFPTSFKKFMMNITISILLKKDKEYIDGIVLKFKDKMLTENIFDVMSNSGINNLEEYGKDRMGYFKINSGTPAHIAATLYHNDFLEYHKLVDEEIIYSGRKIKWCYLKTNPLNINKIALKGYKDSKQLVEFVNKYIDYNTIFEKRVENKLIAFYDALGWGKLPSKATQKIKTLFNF